MLGAGQSLTNTYNQNQPNLNTLASQASGYAGQLGQQAFGAQPGLTQGYGYISNLLNEDPAYNPAINGIVKQGEQDAANNVNSAFSLAGRTGSMGNQTALAKGVSLAGDQIRANQYNTGIGQQEAALGQLPGMTASQYAGVAPYAALSQTAGQLPYYGTPALGAIGSLYGGYGTGTQTQPGGWLNGLINAGAQIGSAAIMASDRRLKRDIERVGTYANGLGKYEWRYAFDPTKTRYRGVMADEVKLLRPDAYVPDFQGGYDGVNYALLGLEMEVA